MKVTICYFSGTGNTKWAACRLQEELNAIGHEVKIIDIEKNESIKPEKDEFIVIGTPVYADLPPKIVDNFVDKLPEMKGIKCAVYSTQAANSAPAADYISNKLSKKGYEVEAQAFIKMPKNYYFLLGRTNIKVNIKDILDKADNQLKLFAYAVAGKRKHVQKTSALRKGFARPFNGILMSYLQGETRKFSCGSECIKCGLCVRSCPKGNITLEKGHAVFHSKCMMCLRCAHLCPRNAIYFNKKKIVQTQKDIIGVLNLR